MRFPNPNSRSAQLFDRAKAVMPGGNTRLAVYQLPYPIFVSHARGSRVTDVDGIERTDFINNQSVLIHGHCFEPAVRAVEQQLHKGSCFSWPTEADLELAELLSERSAAFQRIRFTNSGSEAVMMAVKAARAHTGKFKIAKAEGAYHGTYDFVEASRASSPANWGPAQHPAPVAYTKGTPPDVLTNTIVFPYNNIATTRSLLESAADDLAAVIIEPVANRIGMIPAEPAFIQFLRDFCTRHKIVLIMDEVYCFRLGVGGAQARYGVQGDLTALGKIIGGGFPVGAVAGSSGVMDVFDPSSGSPAVPHTGTFNGNPISMTAGLATLRHLDDAQVSALNQKGDALRARLNEVMSERSVTGQVTGAGSLFRVHFTDKKLTDYRSAYPDSDASAKIKALQRSLLNEGFCIAVNCSGNLSTALSDADINQFIEAFQKTIVDAQEAKQ